MGMCFALPCSHESCNPLVVQHGNSRMLCGRRKRRQEPPEPYVAVNVFDTLNQLVDTTGMAVAASYVKNKDFWVGP